MFFLISNVVFELRGRFFEKCIHDASQIGEVHPYALSVYNLKAAADDLEPLSYAFQIP